MSSASWQGAAVAVAVTHLAIVLFLLVGGFFVRRRRALLPAHLAGSSAPGTSGTLFDR